MTHLVGTAELFWRDERGEHRAVWLGPASDPPSRMAPAGDDTTAAAALARARRGEGLVYGGDYHNARQLLAAMGRRLAPRSPGGGTLLARFRLERARVAEEHRVLSRLAVPVEPGGRIPLRRAPDVAEALAEALGGPPGVPGLLPLRDLLGMIGAREWRRRGVEVPALGGRVHPWYGVYAPIRGEYVDLVAEAAGRWPVAGKRALDVGTGTGVLALVLAQRGAEVTATDLEPRAVGCAREDAAALGLAGRVEVIQADLFPEAGGPWDLVVSNPPWVPGEAHGLLDRAVYDPGGRFLERLLAGLPPRLSPAGEAWLVLSDLAERIGLRPHGAVDALVAAAGLRVAERLEARPTHPRAQDARDPLHAARTAEVTTLRRLVRAG